MEWTLVARLSGTVFGLAATAFAAPAAAQVANTSGSDPLPLGPRPTIQDGTVRSDPSLRLPRLDSETQGDLAVAQSSRLRGVTVDERPRPEYASDPVPVGAFLLSAEGSARAGYEGNVFRQRNGTSDAYGLLTASARLASNTSRNLLVIDGSAAERAYAKYTTESAFTYMAHAGGRLDLGTRDSVSFDVRRQHQVLERNTATEIISTRRPVRYDLTALVLSGHKMMGRFGVDLAGTATRRDYQDAETPDGVPIDQDRRDHRSYGARLDLSYELGPGPVVFAAIRGERRRYDQRLVAGIDRDSNQYEVLGGLRGDITPLLRGQIGVGYIRAELKSGRAKGGVAVDGHLDYLISELTTISLDARREFRNVASLTTPEALATHVTVQVDHELLRNLILSAAVIYDRASYITGDGGSTEVEGRVGADYLINRRFRLTGGIGYRNRNGFGRIAERDYNQLAGNFGVAVRL